MPTTSMYRVTQVATGVAGSPYYLTGYFAAADSSAQQAADAWRTAIGVPVATFVAPYRYEAITEVATVNPGTGDTTGITAVTVAAITFTDADQPLPAATSLLLRWHTGVFTGGREIRGRTNIARLGELTSTLGVPNVATTTAWQTRANDLIADVNTTFVVWSPLHGLWETVQTGSPWGQWAVLRSRRD